MGNVELLSLLRKAFKLYPQSCYVRTVSLKLEVTLGEKKKRKISTQVSSLKGMFLFYMNYIRNVSCSSWACEAELSSPLLRQKFTFLEIFLVRSLS